MAKIIIQPKKPLKLGIKEFWEHRELLWFLLWRNIKVRYKQTVFGVAWVIIKPLLLVGVFSVVFGKLARLPSEGIPYPIFTFSGILAWDLFAGAFSRGGSSLVLNRNFVTKAYFPRIIIPLAAVIEGLVDFCASFIIFLALLFFYGLTPKIYILGFFSFVISVTILSFGVSLWLSALNVRYRDINFAGPFLAQIWLYASPVAYALSLVPQKWRLLYACNPMVGIIEGFRWALLGKGMSLNLVLPISLAVTSIIFISGLIYFRKTEKTFADII